MPCTSNKILPMGACDSAMIAGSQGINLDPLSWGPLGNGRPLPPLGNFSKKIVFGCLERKIMRNVL